MKYEHSLFDNVNWEDANEHIAENFDDLRKEVAMFSTTEAGKELTRLIDLEQIKNIMNAHL